MPLVKISGAKEPLSLELFAIKDNILFLFYLKHNVTHLSTFCNVAKIGSKSHSMLCGNPKLSTRFLKILKQLIFL